jgi:hypothetical protein
VIELSKDVLYETRFKKSNPGYVAGKPCIDVKQYGLHLLPELYELYGALSYDDVCALEVELAIDFREAGYRVWQA